MHIAPNTIYPTIRRAVRSLCSARWLVLCCSLACFGTTTAAWADPADGQNASGRKDESRQQQARGDWRVQQQRPSETREADPRQFEARVDEHRRTQQEQAARNSDGPRRNGRLTDDQRRDLRRQINEAGQAIYATPPRH